MAKTPKKTTKKHAKKKVSKKETPELTKAAIAGILGDVFLDGAIDELVLESDLSSLTVDINNTILIEVKPKIGEITGQEIGIRNFSRLMKAIEWSEKVPEFKVGKKQLTVKCGKTLFKFNLCETKSIATVSDNPDAIDEVIEGFSSKDKHKIPMNVLAKIIGLQPMYSNEFIVFKSDGEKLKCGVNENKEGDEGDVFSTTLAKTKGKAFNHSYNFETFAKIIKRCIQAENVEGVDIYLKGGDDAYPMAIVLNASTHTTRWCMSPMDD